MDLLITIVHNAQITVKPVAKIPDLRAYCAMTFYAQNAVIYLFAKLVKTGLHLRMVFANV
jgi:hypothetical protein